MRQYFDVGSRGNITAGSVEIRVLELWRFGSLAAALLSKERGMRVVYHFYSFASWTLLRLYVRSVWQLPVLHLLRYNRIALAFFTYRDETLIERNHTPVFFTLHLKDIDPLVSSVECNSISSNRMFLINDWIVR